MACGSCGSKTDELYQKGGTNMTPQENQAAIQAAVAAFTTKVLTDAAAAGLTVDQVRSAIQGVNQSLGSQKVSPPPVTA